MIALRKTSLLLLAQLFAPVATAGEPPADLIEKERAAFDKVAAELMKLSRTCTQSKAYAEARSVLDLGLRVQPESGALRAARDAIEGKADEPRGTFARTYPRARIRCRSNPFNGRREGHPRRLVRELTEIGPRAPSDRDPGPKPAGERQPRHL